MREANDKSNALCPSGGRAGVWICSCRLASNKIGVTAVTVMIMDIGSWTSDRYVALSSRSAFACDVCLKVIHPTRYVYCHLLLHLYTFGHSSRVNDIGTTINSRWLPQDPVTRNQLVLRHT